MDYSLEEKEEALKRKDLSILTNMINSGVDINSLAVPHLTDILLVAINKKHKTLFNVVLEKSFISKNYGFTYLHHAIRTHEPYFLERLVQSYKENNITINEYDSENNNCLHIATGEEETSEEILIYLSDLGISWKEQNKYMQTPLHILLRKMPLIEDARLLEIFKQNKEVFFIKDSLDFSPMDIIESAQYSKEWKSYNQNLLNFIKGLK